MTDPLRPFADAIRLLTRTARKGGGKVDESSATAPGASAQAAKNTSAARGTGETLRARLRSRIAGIEGGDPRKMRETFVETVLLWELGDHLAPDPTFAALVSRVSDQLLTDATVAERLQRVLQDMARSP